MSHLVDRQVRYGEYLQAISYRRLLADQGLFPVLPHRVDQVARNVWSLERNRAPFRNCEDGPYSENPAH